MKALTFVEKLNKLDFESESIVSLLHSLILNFDKASEVDDEIENYIKSIPDDQFTTFGSKLGKCLSEGNEQLKNASILSEPLLENTLNQVNNFISKLISTYNHISENRYKKTDNVASTIDQHTNSLIEIKEKISRLNADVTNANARIDDKIFTLLINTVAILGIFVAISFTGFGVMSIFSNINLAVAITNKEAFIKNVFF